MRNDWPNTTAGRAEAFVGQLPLGVVDQTAQLDDVRADLVDGRAVADQPADLGELRLRVGGEASGSTTRNGISTSSKWLR